jgi:hypothetical protein
MEQRTPASHFSTLPKTLGRSLRNPYPFFSELDGLAIGAIYPPTLDALLGNLCGLLERNAKLLGDVSCARRSEQHISCEFVKSSAECTGLSDMGHQRVPPGCRFRSEDADVMRTQTPISGSAAPGLPVACSNAQRTPPHPLRMSLSSTAKQAASSS